MFSFKKLFFERCSLSLKYNSAADRLDFIDSSSGKGITMGPTGNVGIGTTNPTKTLEVKGEINVTTTDNDISMFMEGGVLIVSG